MADVLIRSRALRVFFPSYCKVWSKARRLRTVAGMSKAIFQQSLVESKTRDNFLQIHKTCPCCVQIKRLLSQVDAIPSSQVTPATESSTEVEKSKKYQALHVMPFSITQGGKSIAHVLLKRKPHRAIVFVRTKVLAVELIRELEEYGLKCSSAESATHIETSDTEETDNQKMKAEEVDTEKVENESRITVMTEGEVEAMESLLPVDLILLVQQPMNGKSFALFCLKKTHAKIQPLDVVLLYTHNDLAFLSQMQTHVDVKKLSPPSFYNVPMMTEGLPSLPRESMVTPRRHLVEPPPPAITATIPPKLPRSKMFQPAVPVPVKQSERQRLNDRVRIYVRGGTGGQGSSYFGGMGGDGGDVVVQCFPNATLSHFSVKENRRILAEHGTFFSGKRGKKRKGSRGRDTIIPVPLGTTLSTDDGQIIGELDEVGSRIFVARGGRGGSPATENWCGEKGERLMIRLETRLMADIALVGFPNAGKSSLLRAISKANPKAADYAFTTMHPNIGMVEYTDHSQVSVADLPGLIEGASVNRGLGHTFLKHTQKARALGLVVDIDGFRLSDKFPARTAFQNVCILLKELVLYDRELLNRPKLLIVTKLDKKGATGRFQELQRKLQTIQQHGTLLSVLQEIRSSSPTVQEDTDLMNLADALFTTRFVSIIPVSAVTSFGLEHLREKIKALL